MVDSPVGGECKLTDMPSSFAIGDFSRATHLTVKTLRHYHETGLLEPAHIDPQTGYRRYTTDQIPVAQIIRRFRDLDMPLNEIRAVLSAPDVQTRNDLIAAHLKRLENDLARTQSAVASLRNLLAHPAPAADIGRRKADARQAVLRAIQSEALVDELRLRLDRKAATERDQPSFRPGATIDATF